MTVCARVLKWTAPRVCKSVANRAMPNAGNICRSTSVKADAREELQKVRAELESARGPTGRGRRIDDQGKAGADAVGKSICRALDLLENKSMPRLSAHLRGSITHPHGMYWSSEFREAVRCSDAR